MEDSIFIIKIKAKIDTPHECLLLIKGWKFCIHLFMVNFFIYGFLTDDKSRQKTPASLSKECGTNMLILKSKIILYMWGIQNILQRSLILTPHASNLIVTGKDFPTTAILSEPLCLHSHSMCICLSPFSLHVQFWHGASDCKLLQGRF